MQSKACHESLDLVLAGVHEMNVWTFGSLWQRCRYVVHVLVCLILDAAFAYLDCKCSGLHLLSSLTIPGHIELREGCCLKLVPGTGTGRPQNGYGGSDNYDPFSGMGVFEQSHI